MGRIMTRVCFISMSCFLLAFVLGGCLAQQPTQSFPSDSGGPAKSDDPPKVSSKQDPLTEAAARKALIAMLERKDAPTFDTRETALAALKKGENLLIVKEGTEGTVSGYWNCRPSEARFSFITSIGGCLYSCEGIFEFADGVWRAKATESSWALVAK